MDNNWKYPILYFEHIYVVYFVMYIVEMQVYVSVNVCKRWVCVLEHAISYNIVRQHMRSVDRTMWETVLPKTTASIISANTYTALYIS